MIMREYACTDSDLVLWLLEWQQSFVQSRVSRLDLTCQLLLDKMEALP